MPTAPLRSKTPAIDVYVKLAQYPVLCDRIRLRMREELYTRGVISKIDFEKEVKLQAVESQRREGLNNPYYQEDEAAWQQRLETIREFHTDSYFANNLGSVLLDQLIEKVLRNQQVEPEQIELTFNPEIAPWSLLFQQGELYDSLPPPEKEKIRHHLEEIKVVLIKRLLSDQLPFIAVAKNIFNIRDLRWIYERMIGGGKIGGKAGGMVLAWKILMVNRPELGPDLRNFIGIPDTYFVGSELIYEFLYLNRLEKYVNQKYLPEDEREAQYPLIYEACMAGKMPDYLVDQLRDVLIRLNGRPIIVRSSSLLEDHLYYSFAGKYATVFCPNQGNEEENLSNLLDAVREIYASTFNPQAMVEREKNEMIDYDERMAIMIQPLVGEQVGSYFFPTVVGIGLSENPLSVENATRKEEGCLRLVWGFAERVTGNQFLNSSCIIALSHPHKRVGTRESSLYQTTQKNIKVVNLESNQFETIPSAAIFKQPYKNRDYVATAVSQNRKIHYTVNFHRLRSDQKFVNLMRYALSRLEKIYGMPVELEFTLSVKDSPSGPDYQLIILQCHTAAQ